MIRGFFLRCLLITRDFFFFNQAIFQHFACRGCHDKHPSGSYLRVVRPLSSMFPLSLSLSSVKAALLIVVFAMIGAAEGTLSHDVAASAVPTVQTTLPSSAFGAQQPLFSGNDVVSDATSMDCVCSCACCLQGTCVPIWNTTWLVSSCNVCSQSDCLARVAAIDALWSSETSSRRVKRSACFVLHMTEQKVCSGLPETQCKTYTTIKSQCTRRTNWFHTASCIGWTAVVAVLVAKGVHDAVCRRNNTADSGTATQRHHPLGSTQ